MKLLKIIKSLFFLFISVSFFQCSSGQKLQDTAPFKAKDVYFQSWVAGIKGGGSGINIFIPITFQQEKVALDSVYFRGKVAKLEADIKNNLFIGRFQGETNQQKDLIMSGDSKDEYANRLPDKENTFPFQLNSTDCVVSYIENDIIKYFKIDNIVEKQAQYFPSAPKH